MTRAAPSAPPTHELTLTCHRTCNTWFLDVRPGTDVAAWLAKHMGQPAPAKATKAQPKAKPVPSLPPLKAKLYAAIVERPGTSHEIAGRVGRQHSSVRGRLCEMLTAGLLLRADGVYRVAP